jgi:hypothetical protein
MRRELCSDRGQHARPLYILPIAQTILLLSKIRYLEANWIGFNIQKTIGRELLVRGPKSRVRNREMVLRRDVKHPIGSIYDADELVFRGTGVNLNVKNYKQQQNNLNFTI